jgi:hypothetical protein
VRCSSEVFLLFKKSKNVDVKVSWALSSSLASKSGIKETAVTFANSLV